MKLDFGQFSANSYLVAINRMNNFIVFLIKLCQIQRTLLINYVFENIISFCNEKKVRTFMLKIRETTEKVGLQISS